MFKRWLLALVVMLVAVPVLLPMLPAQAATGDTYIREISYKLEQPFAGISTVTSFAQYLQLVYAFALGVIGMIAVVLIMFGGLRWLGAAGNEQAITEAKEVIISALTGLVIALLSYMILIFLNPQTLKQSFSVPFISPTNDQNWFDYQSCNETAFGTNTCTVDGKEYVCNTLSCGQLGFRNGSYCRGQSCSDASTKCYPDPAAPTAGEACTAVQCGQYIQSCKDSGYSKYKSATTTTTEQAIRDCQCDYYYTVAKQLNTYPDFEADTAALLQQHLTNYIPLCSESYQQDEWASLLQSYVGVYDYSGSPTATQWNCNFGCQVTPAWSKDIGLIILQKSGTPSTTEQTTSAYVSLRACTAK